MMSHKGVSRTGAAADLDMLVLVNGKRIQKPAYKRVGRRGRHFCRICEGRKAGSKRPCLPVNEDDPNGPCSVCVTAGLVCSGRFMPGDRPWRDAPALFGPLLAVLIVRDEGMSPEALNQAARRPTHGLDQENGLPGSPASGAHDFLVPDPFSPLGSGSWGINPALPPLFIHQGNLPAPLPSPPTTVIPGYFTAGATLSKALSKAYPNAPQATILIAVEAAFEIMEKHGFKLW